LALAVSRAQYDPFIRENGSRWELGKYRVDGYIAWVSSLSMCYSSSLNQTLCNTFLTLQFEFERMLCNICGERCQNPSLSSTDTNPLSAMDPEYLNMYVGFIMWLTVVLSGSRLEISLLFTSSIMHGTMEQKKGASWRLAQTMSPVLAITTLRVSTRRECHAIAYFDRFIFIV